jgi:NADH-quinone oxidoreductase subunit G
LCSSVRIFTNLNKIVRILPQYDETTNWNFLTEKARFLYDGINIQRLKFPAIKKFDIDLFTNLLKNKLVNKIYYSISWEKLKNFLLHFYFNIFYFNFKLNETSKFKIKPIIGDLVDIELLSYLKNIIFKNEQSILFNGTDDLLLASFYENFLNYDFRSNYLLKNLNFSNYNLLILLNINLRLENPLINAKIRQEYLWNNLLIYNFGSKYNLTYKYYQLGNNFNKFLKFIKGQHFLTNLVSNKKFNSLLLVSSNILQQYDNFFYKNLFNFLQRYQM